MESIWVCNHTSDNKSDDRAAGVRFIYHIITDRIGRHEVLLRIIHKIAISEKRRIAKSRKKGKICPGDIESKAVIGLKL